MFCIISYQSLEHIPKWNTTITLYMVGKASNFWRLQSGGDYSNQSSGDGVTEGAYQQSNRVVMRPHKPTENQTATFSKKFLVKEDNSYNFFFR